MHVYNIWDMIRMRLVLLNGKVITGDGKTVLDEASIVVQDDSIKGVLRKVDPSIIGKVDKVIDAEGKIIVPGIVNSHTHGIVPDAPWFPYASKPLSREEVMERLNRFMLEGNTTLANLDGFATIEETKKIDQAHPVNIKMYTIHHPLSFECAKIRSGLGYMEGAGLKERHMKITVEKMLESGAVGIGEVGAGTTMGGVGVTYRIIPEMIKRKTGKHINGMNSKSLRYAVLDKRNKPSFDRDKVRKILKRAGLSDSLTTEETKDLVEKAVLPTYNAAIRWFDEAASLAAKYNVPVSFHHSQATTDKLLDIAQKFERRMPIIASHCNTGEFDTDEAVAKARKLKGFGVFIDVHSVLAHHPAKQEGETGWSQSGKNSLALYEEGLVDIISTDYIWIPDYKLDPTDGRPGPGNHDPILRKLEEAIENDVVDLPTAIATATSNPARANPGLAPNRGMIEMGKIADLVVVDQERISSVDAVVISGRVVVEDGRLVNKYTSCCK